MESEQATGIVRIAAKKKEAWDSGAQETKESIKFECEYVHRTELLFITI